MKPVSPYDRSAQMSGKGGGGDGGWSGDSSKGWGGGGKGQKGSIGIELILQGIESSGALPGGSMWTNPAACINITGLPADTTNVHLYRLLSPFGAILPKGVNAMLNPDGTCRGYGFINLRDEASAQLAIANMNGAIMSDGTVLTVRIKQPRNVVGKGVDVGK